MWGAVYSESASHSSLGVMDEVLKRLLAAEARAEAVIAAAEAERARVIAELHQARTRREAAFEADLAERRAQALREAELRAEAQIVELTHRHKARQRALREQADQNEAAAVAAVLALWLDPAR